jgi:hypothetical protein
MISSFTVLFGSFLLNRELVIPKIDMLGATSLHLVNQKQNFFVLFKTGYFWGKVVPR